MKKGIVVYGSKYGSSEAYANYIAKTLGIPCISYEKLTKETLSDVDVLVFGGGVYVGAIAGSKTMLKYKDWMMQHPCFIFSVGMADPQDSIQMEQTKQEIEKSFGHDLYRTLFIYHFRGNMLYSKMNFKHRTMMKMLVAMLKRDKTKQNDGMVLTYGQDTYFADENSAEPMIAQIRKVLEE